MPSAIATQNLPQRILRRKYVALDFAAGVEASLFGGSPNMPVKGYGTMRFWVGGTIDKAFVITVYQKPEMNVFPGSTPYTFNQTATMTVPVNPTTMPLAQNIVADIADVTITPDAGGVFTDLEIEITLQP